MNIKTSLTIALAKRGMSKTQFAEKMGISRARLYNMLAQKNFNQKTIEDIAGALDLKISEFIALGEE